MFFLWSATAFASPVTTAPYELVDSRIMVQVHLDGQGPYHFVLDTGSHDVVDTRIAEKLGLTKGETFPSIGNNGQTSAPEKSVSQ